MKKTDEIFDCCGYATKNDLLCSDGRTIRKDAFKGCDGQVVPLIWNHRHDDPDMVIGHALLRNRNDGVYTYLKLNDTEKGETCKRLINSGDIKGLSIYANQLKQRAGDVLGGVIKEVSLVVSGANPGAFIDLSLAHSDAADDCVYAYLVGEEYTELKHGKIEYNEEDDNALSHADKRDEEDDNDDNDDNETIEDVVNTMNDKQKSALFALLVAVENKGKAKTPNEDNDDEDKEAESAEEEKKKMKHNAFEGEANSTNVLSHSDEQAILESAKQPGMSFKVACKQFIEANSLQHDAISSGFVQPPTAGNVSLLFPEYKDVRPGAPELITNDQGWIDVVMRKVHKSPISRVRTQQVDIRNIDSLRARGYQKGKQKQQTGNFTLVRRTTDPQTVYVKSALHRDDVNDITDFDYVNYLYNIDRMNLNEEIATAIMLGDGRPDGSDDKIMPEHIRPIWTDDELYTLHRDVDIATFRTTLQGTDTGTYFGDNYVYAEALIESALYARETFKGTGTPDLFITPHMLNVMLLARDRNGHRIFSGKGELASALNVGEIYTAEQFANRVRTDDNSNQHSLLGIMVNLADYTVGSTKGGEITHFTDFDLNFNQMISLLETRISGSLTRVYSAIVLEAPVVGG